MTFFRDGEIPSCSLCRFATEYIPSYTYPYFDPHCSKGHGECKGEKFCGDYRKLGEFYCEDCVNLVYKDRFTTYCEKKKEYIDKFQSACAYIVKKEDVYG